MDAVRGRVDTLLPTVVVVWLVGVAVLMVRMAGGLWHVRRLQIRSLATDPSRWQTAADTNRIPARPARKRARRGIDAR